jgi:hypothetical protein
MEYAGMSAVEALRAARAAGVAVMIDGEGLLLRADAEPPRAVLDALSHQKSAIISLLRRVDDGRTVEDWQNFFDERAGIAEFDGNYSRCDAEIIAFEDCVDRWLALNPPTSRSPENCLLCGQEASVKDTDTVHIVGSTNGPARLHTNCAPRWKVLRRVEARTSLIFLLPQANST